MKANVFSKVATNKKTRELVQISYGNAAEAAKAMELLQLDVAARRDLIEGEFSLESEEA